MKLYLYRKFLKEKYTIGKLYVDGKYYCDTLEDKDRSLSASLTLERNKKLKVYGQTAIPIGIYHVSLHRWTKYNVVVPKLENVPAFEGILIHNGKNQDNTEGCILVGKNTVVGGLTDGRVYMHGLTDMIRAAIRRGEQVTIEVTWMRPPWEMRAGTNNSVPSKLLENERGNKR